MTITTFEVNTIAHLARLELTEDETARYAQQLSAILDYVARLKELDTAQIPATSSVLPPHAALRPDEPRPGLDRSTLLRTAPAVEAEQFRVPAVFE